jgi:hypothetical protein
MAASARVWQAAEHPPASTRSPPQVRIAHLELKLYSGQQLPDDSQTSYCEYVVHESAARASAGAAAKAMTAPSANAI